jgi:hypothetical protein
MPPRYAYWTILVDEQPTAFRAGTLEDLMPTFKRLQARHQNARVVWFQNGKVWKSRLDAQEAMRERGERGKAGDSRQVGFRDRQRPAPPGGKLEWRPKGQLEGKPKRQIEGKPTRQLDWTPKGESPRRKPPAGERRDRTWRPGGEHRDPRQKYKDAKKAKWTRFKTAVRQRWEKKQGRKKDDE